MYSKSRAIIFFGHVHPKITNLSQGSQQEVMKIVPLREKSGKNMKVTAYSFSPLSMFQLYSQPQDSFTRAVPQIRRGNKDNLGIIFLIFAQKHTL